MRRREREAVGLGRVDFAIGASVGALLVVGALGGSALG